MWSLRGRVKCAFRCFGVPALTYAPFEIDDDMDCEEYMRLGRVASCEGLPYRCFYFGLGYLLGRVVDGKKREERYKEAEVMEEVWCISFGGYYIGGMDSASPTCALYYGVPFLSGEEGHAYYVDVGEA